MKKHKDLIYTSINQLWRIVSGPFTILFIPLFLSPEIQGYWFTFISICALSIFADLGFTNIVLQFSAHEFAHLKFDKSMTASGKDLHLKRLSSFFMFTVKWASMMVAIAFPLILIAGIIFFSRKNDDVVWLLPWIIFVTGSGINFLNSAMMSFFEGCDQVAGIQKIRFSAAVLNTLITLGLMYSGAGLFAISSAVLVSSIVTSAYILKVFGKFMLQMIAQSGKFVHSWKADFLTLFWRYALSFASGYFIFQIYTPLAFLFHGPVAAGKIGISMTLWTTAFTISNIWIYSVTPKINMLVSTGKWSVLDHLFRKRFLLSVLTYLAGAVSFFILFAVLKGKFELLDRIFERFMGFFPLLCLAAGWLLQLIVNSLAVYLRAHKKEPLVQLSMIAAVFIAVSTYFCAQFLDSDYIFIGFLSSFIISLPGVIYIFHTRRKQWHS